jgi:DNA-binding response OmpR family regulator
MNPDRLPVYQQVEYWRAEASRQKSRIATIKRGFMEPDYSRPEWCLPRREVQVFQALMAARSEWVSRDTMYELIFSDYEQRKANINAVECHISKLKAKLSPFGIRVESRRFQGCRINPEDRARLREGIAGAEE